MKKARQSKFKFKVVLMVLFEIRGIIMENRVPDGVTVQCYYKEILETSRGQVRRGQK